MNIVVIDGQGGKIGSLVIEQLKKKLPGQTLTAIGTNTAATAAMLRAGADFAATGENPVIVNTADADIIIGTIGIVVSNALLGEITPAMAHAVGSSRAQKVLIPVNRCHTFVAGVQDLPLADYAADAAAKVLELASVRES